MTSADPLFVDSISRATTSDACWTALADLAKSVAGHRLFTVTLVDEPAGVVRRAYSNRPTEYPTSGTKPLRGNTGSWFDHVFGARKTFVANTIEDIAKVFPDHELIGSMGCGSVVNFPIVLEGNLVATVNLLDAAGRYTPERVSAVESELAVPARLCVVLAQKFHQTAEAA